MTLTYLSLDHRGGVIVVVKMCINLKLVYANFLCLIIVIISHFLYCLSISDSMYRWYSIKPIKPLKISEIIHMERIVESTSGTRTLSYKYIDFPRTWKATHTLPTWEWMKTEVHAKIYIYTYMWFLKKVWGLNSKMEIFIIIL